MRFSLVALAVMASMASASAQSRGVTIVSPGISSQAAPLPLKIDGPLPSFEVASVKRNTTTNGQIGLNAPPGRFTATNVPLRLLITIAYRLGAAYQYVGLPSWVDSERFDIAAKAPEGASPDQMPLMMRSLLIERFKLVAHPETRDTAIYALVLARTDGKLGPKLTPSTVDCAPIVAERQATARARGPGPIRIAPEAPSPGEKPICTVRMNATPLPGGGGMVMTITAGAQKLDALVSLVSSLAGRPVFDRTGLTGVYDYEIQVTPPRPLLNPAAGGAALTAPGATTPAAPLDEGPSMADALRELGLKLESQRGPVEYLVVDSIERPTDD